MTLTAMQINSGIRCPKTCDLTFLPIETGDFFEALNNGLAGIDSQLKYLREENTEIEYYINCL